MKKAGTINFFIILLITFGITFLDTEDLSINNNIKPYICLVSGVVIAIIYFINSRKKQKKES